MIVRDDSSHLRFFSGWKIQDRLLVLEGISQQVQK